MRILGLAMPGATSGADIAIFSRLRDRGLLVDVVDVTLPRVTRAELLVRTFHPNKQIWGRRWRDMLAKSIIAFDARTCEAARELRARRGTFDCVLQVGGMFAPTDGIPPVPLAIFCDYTTKLAERNYAPWFGLTRTSAPQWYDRETKLYRSAAALLPASVNTRQSLIVDYGVLANRVHVVGEGVSRVTGDLERRYDAQSALYVGIDFDRKGGATLLDAFRRVRTKLPYATLHIVGPAPREPQEGVIWHGHVTNQAQLETMFSEASILVLPSICEPFGLAIIEGMAHGLPVIGTAVDAIPELIVDGVDGHLVAPGVPEPLAEKIIDLLSNPVLCAAMGARGRVKIEAQFLWDHVVDRVVDVLDHMA